MLVFLEWIGCIVAFFYGLSFFDARSSAYYDGYYYEYDHVSDALMGSVYLIGSIVVGLIAYAHTKLGDFLDDKGTSFWGNYDYMGDGYYYNRGNYSTNYDKRHHTSSSVSSYVYKSNNDIIKDIAKVYPKSVTLINEVTKHEVKKKKAFFSFKKTEDTTISTTIIPSKKDEEDEKKKIKNAIIKVINQYVCYDSIGEIRTHIVDVERDKENNINVFYTKSDKISIGYELTRYCVIEFLHKELPSFEKLNAVEFNGTNFEEFYMNYHHAEGV